MSAASELERHVEATRGLIKERLFTHDPIEKNSWTINPTASRRTAYR